MHEALLTRKAQGARVIDGYVIGKFVLMVLLVTELSAHIKGANFVKDVCGASEAWFAGKANDLKYLNHTGTMPTMSQLHSTFIPSLEVKRCKYIE